MARQYTAQQLDELRSDLHHLNMYRFGDASRTIPAEARAFFESQPSFLLFLWAESAICVDCTMIKDILETRLSIRFSTIRKWVYTGPKGRETLLQVMAFFDIPVTQGMSSDSMIMAIQDRVREGVEDMYEVTLVQRFGEEVDLPCYEIVDWIIMD